MRPRHRASSVPRGRWSQRDCVPVARAWASGDSDRPKPRDSAEVGCSDPGPKSVAPTGTERDSEALPPGLLEVGRSCRCPLGCPWPAGQSPGTPKAPRAGHWRVCYSAEIQGHEPESHTPGRHGRRRESDRASVQARGRGRSASHPHVVHNHTSLRYANTIRRHARSS